MCYNTTFCNTAFEGEAMDWFQRGLLSVFVVGMLCMFYWMFSGMQEDRLLYNKKFEESECFPAALLGQQSSLIDTKYKLFVCKMED